MLRHAVLRGDPAAWRVLYDGAFATLYRFVYLRTSRNEERADDAIQDIWMTAVRRIRTFDPQQCPFEAWLKTIALNVLRNARRKWQAHERVSTDAAEPEAVADPSSVAAGLELAEQIALAMSDLPSSYQSLLRERYEKQSTIAEIAVERGTSSKAVESLLGRARTAFRAAFARLDRGTA